MNEIRFHLCELRDLREVQQIHAIRLLTDSDCGLFNAHLRLCGQEKRMVPSDTWRKWLSEGTEYFLLFEDGLPAARCAVERYSCDRWEAADVRCASAYRNRGFATELTAAVTGIILQSGKIATCRTTPDNAAMLKVIEKVGYERD